MCVPFGSCFVLVGCLCLCWHTFGRTQPQPPFKILVFIYSGISQPTVTLPPTVPIQSREHLTEVVHRIGFPAVVKVDHGSSAFGVCGHFGVGLVLLSTRPFSVSCGNICACTHVLMHNGAVGSFNGQ